MLFQKTLVLSMFALSISLTALAESSGSSAQLDQATIEQSFNQELLKLTDEQKTQLFQADAYIQRQLDFKDMKSSSQQVRKQGIICVDGKLGLLIAKGGGSICRTGGEKPSFYILGVLGVGVTFQTKAGIYIGVVETRDSEIKGDYEVVSIGFSPGLSADVLYGRSEESRRIFLVGVGIGFGVEIAGGVLVLKPVFEGK